MTHGYKLPSITPTFAGFEPPAPCANSLTRENWLWVADGKPTKFHLAMVEPASLIAAEGDEFPITVNGERFGAADTAEAARRLAACWNACRDMSIERLEASAEKTLLDQLWDSAKRHALAVGRLIETKHELDELKGDHQKPQT